MGVIKKPRTVNNISQAVMEARLKKMLDFRDEFLADVNNCHIKLQKGNDKTGEDCWTASFIPVADCPNCSMCHLKCYDLRNDCWRPSVQKDRARNSAVHKADPERYWYEVDALVKANGVEELRLNVGGDLTDQDFAYVSDLGQKNRNTLILFFTKNYDGINHFLDLHEFPKTVKALISRWEGMPCENPHNLPCSHVLWKNGSTTAPSYGAYYCAGNCSECVIKGEGCWNLKKGEHVIFSAH